MKKIAFILMIVLAGIFIAGCVMDSVFYCPYCSKTNVTKVEGEDGVYKCNNPDCNKKFGVKKL